MTEPKFVLTFVSAVCADSMRENPDGTFDLVKMKHPQHCVTFSKGVAVFACSLYVVARVNRAIGDTRPRKLSLVFTRPDGSRAKELQLEEIDSQGRDIPFHGVYQVVQNVVLGDTAVAIAVDGKIEFAMPISVNPPVGP
jgi:hypothetical protein